jgi:hypothetical protein
MGKEWFIMKHTPGCPFLATGNNIGYILDKEPVSGFAGFKYKDKIKNTTGYWYRKNRFRGSYIYNR